MQIKSYIQTAKHMCQLTVLASLSFNAYQLNQHYHLLGHAPVTVRTVVHQAPMEVPIAPIDRKTNLESVQDLVLHHSPAHSFFKLKAGDKIITQLPYKGRN